MKDLYDVSKPENEILSVSSEGTLCVHRGRLVQNGYTNSECMSITAIASLNLEATFKLIVETWLDQGISAKAIIDRVNSIVANKS